MSDDKFRFRRLDRIGHPDAAEDKEFLASCFIDTGELQVLRNCADPRRLVLGRSGAGKTALLQKLLECEERAISIKPESLALSYISNSTILNFVASLGVKLDIFFRLLWRHVFTVEILKAHFHLTTEDAKISFLQRLGSLFADPKHRQAVQYLEKWGKSFWEETDYRIKEVTTTLERDLKASIGIDHIATPLSVEGSRKLSEEQKAEVAHRAQTVVNKVQIRELSDVIDLLDAVLDDPQKRYFLVIDRLDEDWVEDRVRYLLIRALIETAKDFRSVRHIKIVAALRIDLIDRVFRLTRDAGFQEEKYEGMYLPLRWTREQLSDLIDRRVQHLVRQRYTKRAVVLADLLPTTVAKQPVMDWLLERTFLRPRDLVAFFNEAIDLAASSVQISSQVLKEAEGQYSRGRLRSLADEWFADYPNLLPFVDVLKGRPSNFTLEEVTEQTCEDLAIAVLAGGVERPDYLSTSALQVVDCVLSAKDFRRCLVEAFYRVGLIGLKVAAHERFIWSLEGRRSISSAEVSDSARIAIHPCFWRTLGVLQAA